MPWRKHRPWRASWASWGTSHRSPGSTHPRRTHWATNGQWSPGGSSSKLCTSRGRRPLVCVAWTAAWGWRLSTELCHQTLIFLVQLTHLSRCAPLVRGDNSSWSCTRRHLMPGSANHTITSCVPSTTTLCANYVVGDVWFVLALPRPVVRCPAIRAWRQYSVFSEGAVEHRQLPQLHLPQLVGPLW